MKKNFIIAISIALLFIGCKKANLDALGFPSEKLTEYQFEAATDYELEIPDEYKLTAADRNLIQLTSIDEATGESFAIYAVYIGDLSKIAADTVILYAHGQSAHMDNYYSRATLLANVSGHMNYGVLMMDYRGYGMSEGNSSEAGLSEDVDACIDWLIGQGVSAEKTYYYGYSLGCIPLIERSVNRTDFKPRKLILESPLASVANLIESSLFLEVKPSFLSSLKFDNAEQIKKVDAPLMWLHGKIDDYVAIQNGELVFENHPGPKVPYRVEGANHSNIPEIMGFETYITNVTSFIQDF
ncbi:alpha/beta hydrolase [Crocinitomix catalasitica]|uniref:alpha/beta hydrolase n=1 Tax=Crocinitomix catalasitica TaxID=184607 RepID=UPI000489939E|nr:alpha/beta fold hydrolase [Crocinitomix catalasitica]